MDEHEKTRNNLMALVAGLLPAADEKAVGEHVSSCAACAHELENSRRLVQGLISLPAAATSPFQLARIKALAVARRAENLARRRNVVLLLMLAFFSWLVFASSLPLLSAVADKLGPWMGLSPRLAFTLGLAAWWGSSLLTGLSLVPLLREQGSN